jgi:predicted transcriptional regulator
MLVFNEVDSLDVIGNEMKKNNVYKVLIQDKNQQPVGVITETTYFKKILTN